MTAKELSERKKQAKEKAKKDYIRWQKQKDVLDDIEYEKKENTFSENQNILPIKIEKPFAIVNESTISNEITTPRNFKNAQRKLKQIIDNTATDTMIDRVSSKGGLFDWFDHKVTGDELNKRISQIQKCFISINSNEKKFMEEFVNIYKLIESLDQEYIPGIVGAIKATELSINQNQKTNEDVKKLIDNQKKIIEVLKKQSEKMNEKIESLTLELSECKKMLEKKNRKVNKE